MENKLNFDTFTLKRDSLAMQPLIFILVCSIFGLFNATPIPNGFTFASTNFGKLYYGKLNTGKPFLICSD